MAAGGIGGWLRGWLQPADAGAAPLPELNLPSGDGPLVWLRVGADYDQAGTDAASLPPAIVQLLIQMRRKGLQIAVSRAAAAPADVGTRGVTSIPDLVQSRPQVAAMLQALQPAAILLIGAELPAALLDQAEAEGIPMILAEARLSAPRSGWSVPGLTRRSALSQLTLLLLPDTASEAAATERGAAPDQVEVTGPITRIREPLKHVEAEREALAEAFRGRQLWLAMAVNEAEEDAVIEAHLALMRYSHRAMLIAIPADPGRLDDMSARMEAAGLTVARRSMDDDPTDEVTTYLADDLYELGLWYRLAPVTFMGTTLAGPTDAARDPFEAASLGSAAIHGPQDGAFAAEWAQLDGAMAARRIDNADALSQAVISLLAPDQAAVIAANAWSVSTGGAGVANRIALAVHEIIAGEDAE